MRAVGYILALALVWHTTPVLACGAFTVEDQELRRTFRFNAESVVLPRDGRADVPLFRIKGAPDTGMFLEEDGKRVLEFRGEALLLRGTAVGTLRGNRLSLGKTEYGVGVAALANEPGTAYRFHVDLQRNGAPWMDFRAVTFLRCGDDDDKLSGERVQRETLEVRQRVALFLAWRQLARPRVLPPH